MKIVYYLLIIFPCIASAQLVQADTNMVCKGQAVRLFINPKLFSPTDFCLDYEGVRDGLHYYSSCNQISFDDAFAFARLMKGNLVTVNDDAKNRFVARLKPAYIKWLGFFQDPGAESFNDPPDPASGFVWMSGAKAGYTRWASAQPDNLENANPGKNVILGCTIVTPPEWCDVDKNDGHKYIAIIETTQSTIPVFPQVEVLWETGSTAREIIVNPTKSKYYKVQVIIDGQVYQDSIKIQVPEAKADFSKFGGCGNPFYSRPVLTSNLPTNDLNISWIFGDANNSGKDFKPDLQTYNSGDIISKVKVESISCGEIVLDSSTTLLLEYPFDTAQLIQKELKLNEIFTLNPLNQKEGFIYNWVPPTGLNNPNIAEPQFMALDPVEYILKIDDGFGCKTEEVFQFTIDPNIIIYLPNAFTPNSDNENDLFKIITNTGFYGQLRQFTIFNRWSQIVFDSDKIWEWDGKIKGKDAPLGIYHYALRYEIEKVPYVKTGSVFLIR